jgi:hypothetical protein
MARSTFEGPILSGDNRFGPQRDVGYTDLVQTAFLDFSVTSANTANYGGASGVFVASNNIPNSKATIWTPQAGSYSATGPTAASAPTADATTLVYRGVSFLIPQGANINDIFIDIGTIPKDTAGTPLAVTAIQPYVSNNFATSSGVYATFANISSPATQRYNATFVGTQLSNANATLQDVQNLQPGTQPTWFSQVVVTLAMTTSTAGLSSGQIEVTIRYNQTDPNIGNGTTYPYGNFD